jgi:hypothetical protein
MQLNARMPEEVGAEEVEEGEKIQKQEIRARLPQATPCPSTTRLENQTIKQCPHRHQTLVLARTEGKGRQEKEGQLIEGKGKVQVAAAVADRTPCRAATRVVKEAVDPQQQQG